MGLRPTKGDEERAAPYGGLQPARGFSPASAWFFNGAVGSDTRSRSLRSCEKIEINSNLSRKGARNAKKAKELFLAALAAWRENWHFFKASYGRGSMLARQRFQECLARAMSEELRQSIGRAVVILQSMGAREVYVFGSAAKGTLRAGSDVDLAVSGLPPRLFFRAMSQAADVLDRPLDLIDLDQDVPFTRYLREEGELVRVG